MIHDLLFYVFATLAVVSGFFVVIGKNPISCAVSLVVTLGSMAALFVLLDAHFVATIQVLVYAGAIMVLFVFVIMLLNLSQDELGAPKISFLKGIGVALAASGLVLIATRVWPVGGSLPPVDDKYGTLEQVGRALFTTYMLPFEVISILLTAAVVGAVVIAKRDL